MIARIGLRHAARGAVAVEYAMTLAVFITMVVAVFEFARLMLIYASAVEATRFGARLAVVCAAADADAVRDQMRRRLTLLADEHIDIRYPAPGCSARNCDPVTVALVGLEVPLSIPLVSIRMPVPSFSTSLPAESLDSNNNTQCAG